MPFSRVEIVLRTEQRHELLELRDHAPQAYVREKAAAILKVADGQSIYAVAERGLLRRRKAETVSDWLKRYLAEGQAGLLVRRGRGRKPAFSPSRQHGGGCQD